MRSCLQNTAEFELEWAVEWRYLLCVDFSEPYKKLVKVGQHARERNFADVVKGFARVVPVGLVVWTNERRHRH